MDETLEHPVLATIDGQAINIATRDDLMSAMQARLARGRGFTLFTLNLDHLVKLRSDAAFRGAYARATFVTADGVPVAALARRQCKRVALTTGSDLVGPACAMAARQRLPLYLFGSSQASLDTSAARLRERFPGLDIVARDAPAFGFAPNSEEADTAGQRIGQSGARLCFVLLGAPKQEIFADRMAALCPGVGFICAGAALDFIAGEQVRAPRLFRKAGLEWLWRLLSHPGRLGPRYARCAALLAELVLLEPFRRRAGMGTPR